MHARSATDQLRKFSFSELESRKINIAINFIVMKNVTA
jgi:hypothetical protein